MMNGISTKQCPTTTPPTIAMICPIILEPSGIGTNMDMSTMARAMKNTEKYIDNNNLLLILECEPLKVSMWSFLYIRYFCWSICSRSFFLMLIPIFPLFDGLAHLIICFYE